MLGMRDDIGFAKELLEKNGYIVARLGIDGWIDAVRFGDDYVAFSLQSTWKQGRAGRWVTPKRFSELLGIVTALFVSRARARKTVQLGVPPTCRLPTGNA